MQPTLLRVFSTTMMLIGSATTCLCQSWTLQTSGASSAFFDLTFVDSLRGWAVGSSGTILFTSDGGSSWLPQVSGTAYDLSSVCFVDSSHGWIAGRHGVILSTTNGGKTWEKQVAELWDYWGIMFVDSLHGFLVAGVQIDQVYGRILKTTDGGANWDTTIAINVGGFLGLWFHSRLVGWAVGGKSLLDNFSDDIVLHTTDGGVTWTEQPTPTVGPLQKVKFVDSLFGIAAGHANNGWSILRTVDGGHNWNALNVPGSFGVLDIDLLDTSTFVVLRSTTSYVTSNAGQTWSEVPVTGGQAFAVNFFGPTHGWLAGNSGNFWKFAGTTRVTESTRGQDEDWSLRGPYPNPFNSETRIEIELQEHREVFLEVRDVLGRSVLVEDLGLLGQGTHSIDVKLHGLASGLYFLTLGPHPKVHTTRLVLLR